MERAGRKYSLAWRGFPDTYYCDQFLIYLQWIETVDVVPGGDPNSKGFRAAMQAFEKILAHLVLGCALALHCVAEEVPAAQPQLVN